MSKPPALPTSLPGGLLLPFMSARRRHEICDAVFESLGGVERLTHEADKNSEAYWEFIKLWSKGLPRAVATEHSVSEGLEDMLERLDRAERARTIEGEFTEVDKDAVEAEFV